jgi:hypothetical protein
MKNGSTEEREERLLLENTEKNHEPAAGTP